MLTYTTEQCQRCHGKGTERFLLLFERDCPSCNGTGQIHVPQLTHEQDRRTFAVSALSPETVEILKKKPILLDCLSPSNKADLLRKHSELPQSRFTRYVESSAERQRRLNEEMMRTRNQQQQFEKFMEQNRKQQEDLTKKSLEHQRDFMKLNKQQQDLNNKQFQDFVNQRARLDELDRKG